MKKVKIFKISNSEIKIKAFSFRSILVFIITLLFVVYGIKLILTTSSDMFTFTTLILALSILYFFYHYMFRFFLINVNKSLRIDGPLFFLNNKKYLLSDLSEIYVEAHFGMTKSVTKSYMVGLKVCEDSLLNSVKRFLNSLLFGKKLNSKTFLTIKKPLISDLTKNEMIEISSILTEFLHLKINDEDGVL